MSELGILASVAASASAGSALGFATGLVPGLHVNNIAATTVAYASAFLGLFALLGGRAGCSDSGLLLSCFLVSALVAHNFSEAVPNTYVGIPSGDAVTVLPAHRLAKAGLGWTAVRSSLDGSLAGVLLGAAAVVPVSALLGPLGGLYEHMRAGMGYLVLLLSSALVLSDGLIVPAARSRDFARIARTARILAVFLASGVLGFVVLDTNYFAADLPGCRTQFVPKQSLLLPLFAGLFGLPTLLLSLGAATSRDLGVSNARKVRAHGRLRGITMSLVGGVLVGWIPGLTSGSSATLCSPAIGERAGEAGDVEGSMRFIWLYSAISSAGAVLSVGALFTILRSRSGIMDAVSRFIQPEPVGLCLPDMVAPTSILLSMVLSALLSYSAMGLMRERLRAVGAVLCSRGLAVSSAAFVVMLVSTLTGLRGLFLLVTACCLGILPPLIGVRRIHLMGCLLVPVTVALL